MIEIPLRDRHGSVITHALIDDVDAAQADHRWYLLKRGGYVVRTVNRQMLYLHREILGITASGPHVQGDHIHGNKLDNRRAELRAVTRSGNMQNRGANRNRSLPRGVYVERGGWMAKCKLDGRTFYLGNFPTIAQAAAAAATWRAEHMPFSPEATVA